MFSHKNSQTYPATITIVFIGHPFYLTYCLLLLYDLLLLPELYIRPYSHPIKMKSQSFSREVEDLQAWAWNLEAGIIQGKFISQILKYTGSLSLKAWVWMFFLWRIRLIRMIISFLFGWDSIHQSQCNCSIMSNRLITPKAQDN